MSYRVMFPLAFIALLGFAGANGQGGPGGGPGGPPGTNGGPTGGTTTGGPGGGAGGMVGGSGVQSSGAFLRGGCCNEKNAGGPSGRFPICMIENGNGVFTDGMAPPSDSCGGGPSDPETCPVPSTSTPVSDCAGWAAIIQPAATGSLRK